MESRELAVWSALLGGLLALAALAVADVLYSRSKGSTRNLRFVLTVGGACVIVAGLPEALFPELPQRLVMVIKTGIGPMSSAMALFYLGKWLGGMREDRVVYRVTVWGSAASLAAGVLFTAAALMAEPDALPRLLEGAGATTLVAAILGVVVASRAARLGDPLARWMVPTTLGMVAMVAGLYARALQVSGYGLGAATLTAVLTLSYFLMSTVLVFLRNRQNRQLARLAQVQFGSDPATGLPTGSALLARMEEAFARAARLNNECTVVCLALHNLYELSEIAGQGVENQILAALAARIRRAAGFRSLVGLYHPRCFVVVLATPPGEQSFDEAAVDRIRALSIRPLTVMGRHDMPHAFVPQVGLSVYALDPGAVTPQEVLYEAERQALTLARTRKEVSEDEIVTAW